MLKKFDVPLVLLSVICSFHVDMRAAVRVQSSDSFTVRNRVRQGCTIVSVLFNLYFCAMVDDWRKQCPQAGLTFFYCFGHKLVRHCTPKANF